MAEDWIKMRKKLANDGRVLEMSRKCRACRATVIGALCILWSLADDYADGDGRFPGYTVDDIDRTTEVKGFGAALPIEWLEVKDGIIYLPNYQEHNGETSKQRALNTKRKHKQREGDNLSRSQRDKSATRREEIREEDNKGEESPLTPLAPSRKAASEPEPPTKLATDDPVLMTFPVVGNRGQEWPLVVSKLGEYRESYPGVDVLAESRKALQWCRDNPAKRKTPRGMPAFLGRWFEKAQNTRGGQGSAYQSPGKAQETIMEKLERIKREKEAGKSASTAI